VRGPRAAHPNPAAVDERRGPLAAQLLRQLHGSTSFAAHHAAQVSTVNQYMKSVFTVPPLAVVIDVFA